MLSTCFYGFFFNQKKTVKTIKYAAFLSFYTEIYDWCSFLIANFPRFIATENSDLLSFKLSILPDQFPLLISFFYHCGLLFGFGLQRFLRRLVLVGSQLLRLSHSVDFPVVCLVLRVVQVCIVYSIFPTIEVNFSQNASRRSGVLREFFADWAMLCSVIV